MAGGPLRADTTESRKPTGRPKSLSPRDKRRIAKAVKNDRRATYGEIKDELGLTCSTRTINTAAIDAGYKSLDPPNGKGK